MPALAAVVCAGLRLATPTERRGVLGSRGTGLPQTRAPCRNVRVPQWVTAQNRAPCRDVRGRPPGRAPRESGSPATHPIGQPGTINRAEVNVATCSLVAGLVRGKQDTGRRTPADGRRPVAAGREVSPFGSPSSAPTCDTRGGYGVGLGSHLRRALRSDLPAPGCGGAPAPSPRSAL